MVLAAVVGHSNDPDSNSAIVEILKQCQQKLDGKTPQVAILLAAIEFDYALILEHIHTTFPNIQLIGGTTDAELSSELGFQQDSLVLLLLHSDDVEMRIGVGQGLHQDPDAATQAAVNQAKSGLSQPAELCLTLADTLGIDGNSVVTGLRQALGDRFPIFGGMTADQLKFQQTFQFYNREVFSNSVVVLLFAGAIQFSHSVTHGWVPLSQPAQITEVSEGVLKTINDKPALEFYHHYLNGIDPSIEYPLAIQELDSELDPQKFYLRSPLRSDANTGEIFSLAGFPESGTIQIAHASSDDLIAAAGESFQQALADYPAEQPPKQPQVAIVFSCCTRRLITGRQTAKEYQEIQKNADPQLPIFGFYTYGEIAPIGAHQPTQLHHETIVTLLLGTK